MKPNSKSEPMITMIEDRTIKGLSPRTGDEGKKHPARIFIIEDDPILARLIDRNLTKAGYITEIIENGGQTIARILEDEPSLLLLDYGLPDMNGRELIDELDRRGVDVPFIIMTGHQENRLAVDMMKLGARDYLIKGGDFHELIPQVVKQVMEQLASERKLNEAEEQIKESESRYRLLFERDLAGNYHPTLSGKILDRNESFAHILGYDSREEVLQLNSKELYFADADRRSFLDHRGAKKEQLCFFEIRVPVR